MYDALKVDFKSEHRLVVCRPHGLIDDYFTIQLLNFLFALEEVAEPFNRLLDLTLATDIPLTSKSVQEYANARRKGTAHLPPFRTAIVAPRPESEAVAHLYANLVKDSKIEVGIFPNVSAAAQWLNLPEEILLSVPPNRADAVNALPQRREAT
jgi:hypothetical protein